MLKNACYKYIIHIDSCHWSFRCFYFAKYKNIPAWIRTSPEVRCIFTCFKLKFQTFWNKREDFFKLFMGIGDAHKTNFILINRCIQSKLLFFTFYGWHHSLTWEFFRVRILAPGACISSRVLSVTKLSHSVSNYAIIIINRSCCHRIGSDYSVFKNHFRCSSSRIFGTKT